MRALAGIGLRLAALAALLFVFVQWLPGFAGGPAYATVVQRLEAADLGIAPDPGVVVDAPGARIAVVCLDGPAPRAVLLRNGRPVGRFRRSRLVVAVRPGDVIEIDGRRYRRRLEFQVTFAGPGLTLPRVGERVATVGDVALVGRVSGG